MKNNLLLTSAAIASVVTISQIASLFFAPTAQAFTRVSSVNFCLGLLAVMLLITGAAYPKENKE